MFTSVTLMHQTLTSMLTTLQRHTAQLTLASLLLAQSSCGYVKEYLAPNGLVEGTVTTARVEEFYDGETGYKEMIHYVELDSFDGCLKDETGTLKQGDHIRYITLARNEFPGSCDVITKYLEKQ